VNKTAAAVALMLGAVALTGCADDDDTECTTFVTAGISVPAPRPPVRVAPPAPRVAPPKAPKAPRIAPKTPKAPSGPRTHVMCHETDDER